jgi:hypothetical protein
MRGRRYCEAAMVDAREAGDGRHTRPMAGHRRRDAAKVCPMHVLPDTSTSGISIYLSSALPPKPLFSVAGEERRGQTRQAASGSKDAVMPCGGGDSMGKKSILNLELIEVCQNKPQTSNPYRLYPELLNPGLN